MPLRRRVHGGHELTDSAQTLLTFNSRLTEGGAILWGFTIVNLDGDEHLVTVHLVPNGQGETEARAIFEEVVPPHSTVSMIGPWHEDSGAFVSAASDDANSGVGIRLIASEEYLS